MSDGSGYGAQQHPSGNYAGSGGGSYGPSQNPASPYGSGRVPVASGPGRVPIATKPTAKTREDWQKLAYSHFLAHKRQIPGRLGVEDSQAYNRQITAAYAKMYLSNRKAFKWAGMAAFASKEVGAGMQAAWNLAWGAGAQTFTPAALWVGGLILGRKATRAVGELLFWALARGNQLLWHDVFWQHLAYRDGGFEALKEAKANGGLEDRVFAAWTLIHDGITGTDLTKVWQGNAALLRYEQEVFLQQTIYDRKEVKSLWKEISGDVPSPVPGHGVDFIDHVPDGNIGVFTDRWKWVEESMLPAWKKLETDDPERVKKMLEALQ